MTYLITILVQKWNQWAFHRYAISSLWKNPDLDTITQKALTVPILNPFNKYGRVFFLSWFSFFVAFLSWFAFPPLIHQTIATDLHMSEDDVANSNIVGLLATLAVRLVVGPMCDAVGPRYTMIICLLVGSIPTALAATIYNIGGLMTVRFFLGILGGTFVPCQAWCTGFFDTSVVGTANAIAAGWGNAGGGVTYFVLPAIYNALAQRLTSALAWRVSFVVCPFLIIILMAILCFLGDDTPTGSWKNRKASIILGSRPSGNSSRAPSFMESSSGVDLSNDSQKQRNLSSQPDLHGLVSLPPYVALTPTKSMKSSCWSFLSVVFTLQTALVVFPYFSTFGTELAVAGMLSNFYMTTTGWTEDRAGVWAATFGLMNVIARPFGGYIADVIYFHSSNTKHKHYWVLGCCLMQGLLFNDSCRFAYSYRPHHCGHWNESKFQN